MLTTPWQALTQKTFKRVVPFADNEHLNKKSLRARVGFFMIVMYLLPLLIHGLTLKGLIFAVVPIYMFSLCFMISTQINHLVPQAT